jgi:hypothetical protein
MVVMVVMGVMAAISERRCIRIPAMPERWRREQIANGEVR